MGPLLLSGCACGDRCLLGVLPCHLDAAIEDPARSHSQNRCADIAMKAAGCRNLHAALGIDAAVNLAVDLDFTNLDVGMDDGMFTDYQNFTGSNRAVEVAV